MLGLYVTLKISIYNEAAKHLGIQTALVNVCNALATHFYVSTFSHNFCLPKTHFLLFLNTNASIEKCLGT